MIITDGRQGFTARVDSNNRMHTDSTTEPLSDHAANFGKKFNINTGDITITDAVKLTLLYIKNNEEANLVITGFIYNLGNTTSGTGDVLLEVIRNPTAGAIITNANDVAVGPGVSANQNFGSNEFMTGLFYKGAVGEAVVSDGAVTISTRSAANTGRIVIALGAVVIPKGSSVAVNYTPPTSNSSQKVQIAASCYLKTKAVADTQ